VTGGSIVNSTSNTWAQYTFTVTATGASTALEFTGRQDNSFLHLTDISVGSAAPATPAPGTLVLMIAKPEL